MNDRELMQQALEALEAAEHLYHHVGLVVRRGEIEGVITALRERLAQPERAEKMREAGYTRRPTLREFPREDEQPQQAWITAGPHTAPLRTHWEGCEDVHPECRKAQRREWVGLTDEEVSKIIDNEIGFNSCWGPEEAFARAIEAKLKEKNA